MEKRINIEGINQCDVIYIFPVPNALISLGGDTVNKIDHYKIHEVQEILRWVSLLLEGNVVIFFPSISCNKSTHSVAWMREKGKFAYRP